MMRIRNLPSGSAAALALVALLSGCSDANAQDDELDPGRGSAVARILPAAEGLEGAHIPTLDPARMNDAEIAEALGAGPTCLFRYTSSSRPIVAIDDGPAGEGDAVIKLNGDLVLLRAETADASIVLAAEPIRMTLAPLEGADDGQREATAIFEIGDSLRAGYRGYYDCVETPVAAGNS